MLALLLTFAARAAEPCADPRAAAESFVRPLRAGRWDPAAAARCFDLPDGADGARLAVQLDQVLHARRLIVPVHTLVAAPDAVAVAPVEGLPELVLAREPDGTWRWSRASVEAIPGLYADTFSTLAVAVQGLLPLVAFVDLVGFHPWQLVMAVGLLVVGWVLGRLSELILHRQVGHFLKRAQLTLDEAAWRSTRGPILAFVAFVTLWWGLPELFLSPRLLDPVTRVVRVGCWVSGVVVALRLVSLAARVASSLAAKTPTRFDDQAVPMVRQSAQLLVVVFGALYVTDAMGFDVWKLAAGVGIGGLAFALAAQDTVANLFGSINIFLDRPFQVGDWVKIGVVEGVVEEVGFRSTRIRTFYDSLVTVPNSQITSANVDNLGARTRRRVTGTLRLALGTPPDTAQAFVEGVRAILTAHPLVQRSYEVHLAELGQSSLDVMVYYHVVTPSWSEELDTRAQVVLETLRLAERLPVSFAFPTTTVHLASTPDHPVPPATVPTLEELRASFDAFGPAGDASRPRGPDFGRSWSVPARAASEDRGGT